MSGSEDRLTDLENAAAGMEAAHQDLSDMVAEQWKVIDALRSELKQLRDRVALLEEDGEAGEADEEAPPPHY